MIVTSIKEARGNLSSLLQKVEQGEEVVVTRHGKHIARITAPHGRQTSLPSLAEFRAHLAVKGTPLSRAIIDERSAGKF